MHLISACHHTVLTNISVKWKLKLKRTMYCSVNTLYSMSRGYNKENFYIHNGRGKHSPPSLSTPPPGHLPTYHVQQQRATRRALGVWEPWRDVDWPTTKTELTTTEASHVHTTCIAQSSSISTSIYYVNIRHRIGKAPKAPKAPSPCRKLHEYGAISQIKNIS